LFPVSLNLNVFRQCFSSHFSNSKFISIDPPLLDAGHPTIAVFYDLGRVEFPTKTTFYLSSVVVC